MMEMSEKEAVERMDAIEAGDTEIAHGEADDVLLEFLQANGYVKLVAAWRRCDQRAGGFWYA